MQIDNYFETLLLIMVVGPFRRLFEDWSVDTIC